MASDYITIKLDGADFEIKMTAALLMQLQFHVPSPEQVTLVSLDPTLRNTVIRELIATRTKTGKVEGEYRELDEVDISLEDSEAICDWAVEHLLSFFVRRGKAMIAQTQAHQETFNSLKTSSAGSTS